MQGVPGSGKSTVAQMLKLSLIGEVAVGKGHIVDVDSVSVRSTDDYRYGECGHYIHDPLRNAELHKRTQREVADDMREGVPVIIVDNTNIERWQATPYISLAGMYDYEVNVVRVDPGLREAKKRNATRSIERRVPDHVIEEMYAKMESLL